MDIWFGGPGYKSRSERNPSLGDYMYIKYQNSYQNNEFEFTVAVPDCFFVITLNFINQESNFESIAARKKKNPAEGTSLSIENISQC